VPPGKEGKITLGLEHTEGYAGEIAKSASVTTNDPALATFNLILRAHFKAPPASAGSTAPAPAPIGKPSGPFTVSPSNRWISSIISGSSATSRLYFYNREARPIRLTKVVTDGPDFIALLQPIEEGKRYELVLTTGPALKVGQHTATIKLLTDSAETPEIPIQAEVTVYPKVFATPNAINIGRVSAGSDLSIAPVIYVRKLRDGGLKIKKVSSTLPFLKTVVGTESEGHVYTIRLSLDKSKAPPPGEFRGKIVIETNDVEAPVVEVAVQGSLIP